MNQSLASKSKNWNVSVGSVVAARFTDGESGGVVDKEVGEERSVCGGVGDGEVSDKRFVCEEIVSKGHANEEFTDDELGTEISVTDKVLSTILVAEVRISE